MKGKGKFFFISALLLILNVSFSFQTDMVNSFIEVDKSIFNTDNKVQGKMNINGETYTAICDCDPVTPKLSSNTANSPSCDPSRVKINLEKKGNGASLQDVKDLIGIVEELTYAQIPYTPFSCLDGRHSKPVISTPGGDAGEFILALSVYEDLISSGKKLTQKQVDIFLAEYLKLMRPNSFYMCTDDISVSHLEKELQIEGLNIKNPRKDQVKDLIDLLLKPENVGDLHIKMLLKHPDQFSIRKELVEMFLRSFYKIFWNKENDLYKKLELEILTGEHNESGFLEVRSEEACQKEELGPLIPTKNKKISIFVNHLDAASIRREQIAKFFSDKSNHGQEQVDAVKMHNRLNHHGFVALEITGSYIAKSLPFTTINLA